jgi:predicted SAM-dependent methyltransferase
MGLKLFIRNKLSHFMPMPVWRLIRLELALFKVRLGRRRMEQRFKNATEALVNVGTGASGRSDWINVDAFSAEGVNCLWDCRYPLPLPDNCARGIFTEHFLEHLDYQTEIPAFLKECLRIMQSGAVIRIIVPDAAAFLKAYCAPGWEEMIKLRLSGEDHKDIGYDFIYRTKMQVVNFLFRQGEEHKYAYDFETFRDLLEGSGFINVTNSVFGESRMPELILDKEWRARESLYIEAVKA